MGLTNHSTGLSVMGKKSRSRSEAERVIALAGNPNVGKSTVFNALTGMNQHTGNWPGKTVTNAEGICKTERHTYLLTDLPGTYSLMAHSAEEETARNFLCFGGADAAVVLCDATCLERNLNLALQTTEITERVVLCVNLMDEAKRKGITIDLEALSERLGIPVVGITARKKSSLARLTKAIDRLTDGETEPDPIPIRYLRPIEEAISILTPFAESAARGKLRTRWLCLKLLEGDESLLREIDRFLETDLSRRADVSETLERAWNTLSEAGITRENLKDRIVSSLVLTAEELCMDTVRHEKMNYDRADRRADQILTSRLTGYPIMILLLLGIFWITITGANLPSQLLMSALFGLGDLLRGGLEAIAAPGWLCGILIDGAYKVLAWVVSVMLPPMAIFFPLFTLLEDSGYLPRIAYNLDKPFQKCSACGKQALTMAMGFGCNAAGVVGCRIIDSPRERLIAMLTNCFVPCNGRFPMMISVITMFFIGTAGGAFDSAVSALLLTLVILLGIGMTFAVSKLLSRTVLKGIPSSFTLELPPYRRPQFGKVIVRSIFDRTLFVLGRAASVAAPAGLLIWLAANVTIGDMSVLRHITEFLDPLGRLLGLDGVILTAFLLGLPANEIVVPIIIMTYLCEGSILELESLTELKSLLTANGWTIVTAVNMLLFTLFHWPCSTTLITVKKESGSLKWTAAALLIPTAAGMLLCFLVNTAARLFGLI